MKLIHTEGYSEDEKRLFRETIFSNTLDSMRITLEAMDTLQIEFENPDNSTHRDAVMDCEQLIDNPEFPADIGLAIKSLCADGGIQKCLDRSNEFQLIDSAK